MALGVLQYEYRWRTLDVALKSLKVMWDQQRFLYPVGGTMRWEDTIFISQRILKETPKNI